MPFESLGAVAFYSNYVAVCEIFSVKEWCDLENEVSVQVRFRLVFKVIGNGPI